MSRSNHSRPKKKHFREYSPDRVDDPIERTKKPLKKRIERSKTRIQEKSVEYNLHEVLGVNEKQPDHEKVLNKLIHGLVEKKLLTEKRIQEKSVEQNLHEIIGVNEKQPDHKKALNKIIQSVVEKKEAKISENKVNYSNLTELELGKEGYNDLNNNIGMTENQEKMMIDNIQQFIHNIVDETDLKENQANMMLNSDRVKNIRGMITDELNRAEPMIIEKEGFVIKVNSALVSNNVIDEKSMNFSEKQKQIVEKGHIYVIQNKINGKVYVGQTINTLKQRLNEHIRSAKYKKGRKSSMQYALLKYKLENFIITREITVVNEPQFRLDWYEKYFIKKFESTNRDFGYNLTFGGSGGKHTPEVVEKILNSNKKYHISPEWREKMGNEEWREKTIKSRHEKFEKKHPIDKNEFRKWVEDHSKSGVDIQRKFNLEKSSFMTWLKHLYGLPTRSLTNVRKLIEGETTKEQILLEKEEKLMQNIKIRKELLLKNNHLDINHVDKIIADGKSTKQICELLNISTSVLYNYLEFFHQSRSIVQVMRTIKEQRINPSKMTPYPKHTNENPVVFNKITGRKIQFYQILEDNGGFVYENKIYSFPDYGGKNVLIKIDEIENQILCFPGQNLEEKPLVRPINESEVIQFYRNIGKADRFIYKDKSYSLWTDFPSKKVAMTVNKSEKRIYIHPDQDLRKPPLILNLKTGIRIQCYKKLQNKSFFMIGLKFNVGEEHKNKLVVVRINDEKNEVYVFPNRNLNENPVVFNKITGRKIQFSQNLEDNGGFVYENKIYLFPEYSGKNVLIKIDEIENQILCFPGQNLEEKPLVKPINESEVIQFYRKINNELTQNNVYYKDKSYTLLKDFPSKNVAVSVNKSENRIYIHPDQDLSKPPQILDLLTKKRIQFYQKLHDEGEFQMNRVKFDVGEEHKNKLAVVSINDEKNEISVFPDGDLSKNPLIFDKTTGKKKV